SNRFGHLLRRADDRSRAEPLLVVGVERRRGRRRPGSGSCARHVAVLPEQVVSVVADQAPAFLQIRPGEADDADPDAEAGWIALRPLELLAQPAAPFSESGQRVPARQVPVRDPAGATHGRLGGAADPDGRSALPRRLRRHRHRLRDAGRHEPVRPRLAEGLDDLLQAPTEAVLLDPERLELLLAPAQSDTEDEASL